ncbi:MAG TPA: helix-turn-helix domain-containing protein [Pseudonocardia sp.]|nr:helix-turn-helix domain-containing protein [Pseudonocardia sp.]
MPHVGARSIEEGLRAIADGLIQDEDEHAQALTDEIVPVMPDLGTNGERQIFLSCRANIRVVAGLLSQASERTRTTNTSGGSAPPPETLRYLGMLVHRSLDVESLLEGYRIGHAELWRRCTRVAFERVTEPTLLPAVLEEASEIVFRYINGAQRYLREEYAVERLAHLRWPTARKLDAVQELLQGGPAPHPAGLTELLGYDVSRRHLGFVVRVETGPEDPHAAAPAAMVAAERIGHFVPESGRPLTLPAGGDVTWMWLSPTTTLGAARRQTIAQLARAAKATVGIGEPGEGVEGFRDTHEQALEALDFALRTGEPTARYGEIALPSVLCARTDRAQRMKRWHLGALDADTPLAGRLRDTLRVLLQVHLNQREAARQLGLHPHTIAYRLQQIEAQLGHPVAERAADLHAALIIREVLG